MKKTRLTRLLLTVLLVATILSLATSSFVEVALANPAYENFTAYTETDPNSHISVTNSTYISADLYSNETAYVYDAKGGNHFSGDFEHRIDVNLDNVTGASMGTVWALTDKVDEKKGLEDANENFLATNIGDPAFTFGYTTIGGTTTIWNGGDDLVGCIFTTPDEAVVPRYIHAYVHGAPNPINVKMAIYKNSDLSFICNTDEVAVGVGWMWATGTVQTQVTLDNSTEYLLCVWGSASYETKDDAGAVAQTARDTEAYNGFPNPYVKDNTYNRETSIYCTFTVVPRIELEEYYGGSSYNNHYNITYDTWYYLLIERASSTFTCRVYTNVTERNAEGTPDDTLTITLQSIIKYDNVFAVMTFNDSSLSICEVDIQNYDFQYPYEYVFYGLYNEESGDWLTTGVNVTTHFLEGTPPVTFEVNGTYTYGFYDKPVYFNFNLTKDREYWLGMNENTATIYIFDDTTTTYTIAFYDFAGVLHEYSYIEAKRYVNATLRIVEKRRVDVENKIIMNLITDGLYTIVIGDGDVYTYGDLRVTSTTSITLTLKAVDFPKETLLTYNYVRIYGIRDFGIPNGNITITYEDTLALTTSVDIYVNYKNGTNAYNATVASDSFIHVWSSALNNTDYAVVCDIDHQRYGNYTWKQYFPRTFSEMPWGLGFLGTLPFNTAYILPALLLVFVAGCFSAINAYLGAFATVVTGSILTYMGWLPIPPAFLIVTFTLAILMALIYAKRRITIG